MKKKAVLALVTAACLTMSAAAPLSFAEEEEETFAEEEETFAEEEEEETFAEEGEEAFGEEEETEAAIDVGETTEDVVAGAQIYVQGYEWGPGVPKLIIELQDEASEISADDLYVSTAGAERTVTDVYLCDENGEAADGASSYVAIDMETNNDVSGSPFTYDLSIFMNDWSESYPVIVSSDAFGIDGEEVALVVNEDLIDSRICPDTDLFTYRESFVGDYINDFTGETDEITIRLGAYEPESLAGGEQNPLIIWLHGQGEGGTDVDIEIIGNEVCALARDEIQSYFTAGDQTGAYVLVVQCETYWMDEGDGTNGQGSGVSRYTEAAMDAIEYYVESNPDVDPNRIYIGGCSNGGYMTLNMLINYPDYFAAAYPNCEAYSYYEYERNEDGTYGDDITDTLWVTDEKIETLKDIPIWFVVSIDDPVVDPTIYELPTYRALIQAGADNCWLSLFESIEGTDSPGTTYIGHYAWVYTLNNQVTGVQDRDAIAASTDDVTFGTTPSNDGGGSETADGYDNIFAWMNAQSK